jgi:hypothetical protein
MKEQEKPIIPTVPLSSFEVPSSTPPAEMTKSGFYKSCPHRRATKQRLPFQRGMAALTCQHDWKSDCTRR